MSQEVEVTLTLEVDVSKDKIDIEYYIRNLIDFATLHDTTYNRMIYKSINVKDVKEESEIYQNK